MELNVEKLYKYLDGFKSYIELKSDSPMTDLSTNKFFTEQEGYKHTVYNNAQNILDFAGWNLNDIGTGTIAEKAVKAVEEASNLIHFQQKLHFKNKVYENIKRSEQLLYNIYRLNDDEHSFDDAVAFLGGKYDLLAYLFFIKNDEKFLPINSTNFDERFAMLGIPLKTSRSCSSQNYFSFLKYMDNLRIHMQDYYGFEISLLDAHSVIWQLSLADDFVKQSDERNADILLTEEVSTLTSKKEFKATGYTGKPIKRLKPTIYNGHKMYPRNRFIALNALYIANNCCEIDSSHESFIRKNSDIKYMEPHHLVPMCESDKFSVSLDREENIICLCSNCHNEIHYGTRFKEIITVLYHARNELLKSVGIDVTLQDLINMY